MPDEFIQKLEKQKLNINQTLINQYWNLLILKPLIDKNWNKTSTKRFKIQMKMKEKKWYS